MISNKLLLFVACAIVITLKVIVCEITISDDDYKTVKTKSGRIRGVRMISLLQNVSYYSFKGIPYAKKPIGALRFKAPEPVESWKPQTIDAFEYGKSCFQQSFFVESPLPQSEDCLYLNVFAPADVEPDEKLAVMFFIHGGAFMEGSANDDYIGADFLMEHRVILVTINYRLGAFGFLSLDSAEYSGNMGLKDQQLALKWTYANIANFGGDRKLITVFGQSAGGVSTHYQTLSAESRKLLRRAICMSGTAFNYYALSNKNDHLDEMFHFAMETNNTAKNYDELVDFLKTVSSDDIIEFTSQREYERTLVAKWAPVIERSDAIRPFLLDSPENIYNKSSGINVGMMFGYTNEECQSLALPETSNASKLNTFISEFNLKLPIHGFNLSIESKEYRKLLNRIRSHYFEIVGSHEERAAQYINLISEMNMVYFIDKAAKIHAAQTKRDTFYYQFSVDAKLNFNKRVLDIESPGAGHSDDMCYLFRCHVASSFYTEVINGRANDDECKISYNAIENLTKLFTYFAKYGSPIYQSDPADEFLPIRKQKVNYLDITNEGLIPGVAPKKQAISFWQRIMLKAEELSKTVI